MESYIKTFVYITLGVSIGVYLYFSSLVNKLVLEEYAAYYDIEIDGPSMKEDMYHYLDSLGGGKRINFFGKRYSYPEFLHLSINWGLRSKKGLEGEFEWEPNYTEILTSWANYKDTILLKSLKEAAETESTLSYFDYWKTDWLNSNKAPLKDYFPICVNAKTNEEAFDILELELRTYLSSCKAILTERLKNAEIKVELFLNEGAGHIQIKTQGWLNEKAFRLLLESKGEVAVNKNIDLLYWL